MKLVLLLSVVMLSAVSASPDGGAGVTIVKQENSYDFPGNYKFGYETSDKSSRQEEGKIVKASNGEDAISVEGMYSFTGADGKVYLVTYTADEKGYRPVVKPQ